MIAIVREEGKANANTDVDDRPPPSVNAEAKAFVLAELCKLALNVDYSDEIGRRKMFQLAQEMICEPLLPETIVPHCMNILNKILNNERDLIRVIVDVITELRMGPEEDRSRGDSVGPSDAGYSIADGFSRRINIASDDSEPMTEEERVQKQETDLRALIICINLLESVNGTLQENSVFHGLLPDLIVPACSNKESEELRSQGLICLGLCCMIDQVRRISSWVYLQENPARYDAVSLNHPSFCFLFSFFSASRIVLLAPALGQIILPTLPPAASRR